MFGPHALEASSVRRIPVGAKGRSAALSWHLRSTYVLAGPSCPPSKVTIRDEIVARAAGAVTLESRGLTR
jgi:hypothetical protein